MNVKVPLKKGDVVSPDEGSMMKPGGVYTP